MKTKTQQSRKAKSIKLAVDAKGKGVTHEA